MKKVIKDDLNMMGDVKPAGFIVPAALALWIMVIILSFPASAFSQIIKAESKENYSNVPITCENATDVSLLYTLTDHLDRAWTVAFSPDGRLLASCGQDGKVLVRDIDTLSVSTQMGGFSYWVVGLAFSPGSHYLAYGGALGFSGTVGPIGIWNVVADSLERALTGHSQGCWSLDFQESTNILASSSFDGTVKLWDIQTGALLNTLHGHTGAVLSVDFNPGQNLLASSGTDYTVRLWDSQTGSPVRVLTGHTGNIGYVKFSPDGLTVASSADDGTVRLWNVADGSLIWSRSAGQGWVNCVNFNPDGSLLVTCGHDGSVVLRDATTGLQLARLEAHLGPVIRGAFNPAGTLLATASWDKTVRLWGIEIDTDADGVPDSRDNCPGIFNPEQEDLDIDGIGDPCDNCPLDYNPGQEDSDGYGFGDACDFICGDASNDGLVNILDIIYLIDYKFKGGPAPAFLRSGDVNGDLIVNILDIIYLIDYKFKGGPEPFCGQKTTAAVDIDGIVLL